MNNKSFCVYILLRNNSCYVTAIMILLVAIQANAQKTLQVSEAINKAFLNRKNIQAGKLDQTIRRLQTDALYRKYWPQLTAEYTYLYNPILQTSILPIGIFNPAYPIDATKSVQFGTKWTQTAGLMLTQPLIDVSINRQIREGKLQERITVASQAQTEYELAYTVAQVYVDILLQESKIRSAIADTNRTWANYQLLNNRFEQKRLLKSELNKGRINHNNALQQYRGTVAQLIENRVYLLFLIGDNNTEPADINLDSVIFKNDNTAMLNAQPVYAAIPEIQQLQLKGDVATLQAKTEKAKLLPTLNIKGYLGANQYTNSFDPVAANSWFGLSYVGIDFRYPLLFGENVRKKSEQLHLQSQQYNMQKDDRTAQYYKDALIAKLRMDQILSELKTQEENIELSIESVEIFQARVAEGQESESTLNSNEADLQKQEAEYQSIKKQYWLYFLDYLKNTGKMELLWK